MTSTIAWIVAALCAIGCGISIWREPRRLRSGVLLVLALLAVLVALATTDNEITQGIAVRVLTPLIVLAGLGYVALALFLLVNGCIVMVREGRSLAMMLPLVFGLLMIAAPIFVAWCLNYYGPDYMLLRFISGVLVAGASFYFACVFLSFVIYGALYRLKTRSPDAGVILILGSRIFDGKVPPLLAARLERAITVYRRHEAEGLPLPLLICCGGQGADESRAEAAAMADYLREQGIREDCIGVEDQSTTTRENLIFGSRIAAQLRPDTPMLVATNDYHVFRTALLTHRLHLRAQVVPARTARYYVPAAFLREFIAIVRDNLWVHAAMLGIFAAFVGFLVWESLSF